MLLLKNKPITCITHCEPTIERIFAESQAFRFCKKAKREMANGPGHWSQGLVASMNDPQSVVHSDDIVVIIKDKYPKALFHFLVLPKKKIPSLKSLTAEDLPLLKHMHNIGNGIAKQANSELSFRFGYHAVPSMSHLHMHVISQDFSSPCLKTKKHWNSFTTNYFVDSLELMKEIKKSGKFYRDMKEMNHLLKLDLRCHVCKKLFPSMPALKAHIVLHDLTVIESSS